MIIPIQLYTIKDAFFDNLCFNNPKMQKWLIVGLGNPGQEYALTRHNAGFLAAEAVRDKHAVDSWKKRLLSQALTADIDIANVPCVLILPQTYMNVSGKAVRKFVKSKDDIKHTIVLHDDVHIPIGEVKIKFAGGDAGHNGITSITEHLKTKDFIRIRIGVGPLDSRPVRLVDYVLGKFSPDEREILKSTLSKVELIISDIITAGLEEATKKWHTKK